MSAIKDGRMPVELNGKTYYLLFSLNALDEMQDRFGGYDKLDKAFDQSNPTMIKDLRWLLTLIINEGMEEGETPLTEQQVGKLIHIGNLPQIKDAKQRHCTTFCMDTGTPPEMQPRGYGIFRRRHMGRHLP